MTSSKTRSRVIFRWALILVFLFGLCLADAAWACPTCKDGLQNGANAANLVRGYFWSILFMMSMPFLILAALCSYFYIQVRRAAQLAYSETTSMRCQ